MRGKPIYSFLIFLIFSFSALSQKKPVKFHSINQFGIAGGESEMKPVFQTVSGIQFANWFSGIGIGVDNYRYKTLPLFIHGRRYFGADKNGFIYADFGYDFSLKNKPGKEVYYYDSYHFKGGIYTDIGIGYQFYLSKNSSFLFSLGYSYKELQSKIGVNTCPFIGPCYVDYSKYNFDYGRMVLKAGLVF